MTMALVQFLVGELRSCFKPPHTMATPHPPEITPTFQRSVIRLCQLQAFLCNVLYRCILDPHHKEFMSSGQQQFCFLFYSLGPYPWHMEVPRLGVKSQLELLATVTARATNTRSELHLWPIPQLPAMLVLTHWVRPGIKTASSWTLVRLVTTELWQELQQ